MTWARLDDTSAFHMKVLHLGNAAWGALCRMIAHSCHHLTDGFISFGTAKAIASDQEMISLMSIPPGGKKPALFLDESKGGYIIHDFHKCNPYAKDVIAKRDAELARRNKGKAVARVGAEPYNNISSLRGSVIGPDPDPTSSSNEEEEKKNMSFDDVEGGSGSDAPPSDRDGSHAATPASATQKPRHEAPSATPTLFDVAPPKPKGIESVREVFAAYVAEWRKHNAKGREPILDAKRSALIQARLADFSVGDLQQACVGIFRSPYHMGENPDGKRYLSPDLLFRDAKHVEDFMAHAEDSRAGNDPQPAISRAPLPTPTPEEIAALEAEIQAAGIRPKSGTVEDELGISALVNRAG